MISRQIPSRTQKAKKENVQSTSNSAVAKREETQQQNGAGTARKKTETEGKNDGKQQRQRNSASLKRKTDGTDDLEEMNERKHKIMAKGQNEKMAQKQLKSEEKKKATNKPTAVEHQPNNGVNPLDTILDEIEAFDTANKKNKKAESEDDEVNNAPCSSRQLPPTPMPGSYRSLSRIELARQDQNQGIVHSFLAKDDLMQRLLAYKMLKGRVESYSTIRIKIDLDDCKIPDYELSPAEFGRDFPSDAITSSVDDGAPVSTKIEEINSETAEQAALKRGPMTPPGSPGTNISSAPDAEAKAPENLMSDQNVVALRTPVCKKEIADSSSTEENATREMLVNFCSVTGISMETVRTFLGDGLHKLDKLKMEDLMATFLVSLKRIATKRDGESDKECSSANVIRSPVPSVALPKEENKSVGSEGLPKVSAEQRAADNFEMDAMEISSQSAVSSGAFSFSNGLLPPPPAPPPILDGTDCETAFIVPPPPPPPPLRAEEHGSFLPSSTHNFATSPSQIMSKVCPSNYEHPSPPQTRISENVTASLLTGAREHFPAVVRQFKRLPKHPKIYRGKQIPLRFPKPMKSMARKDGDRVERFHHKTRTATSTLSAPRPVSLLSLNLAEPTPGPVLKTNEVSDTAVGTSMLMQQQTKCLHVKANNNGQQPNPSREVPIVIDLEFIKNTPPPPIPDIIRRRIPNDNGVALMRMNPTSSQITSQPPKILPQSLLRLDLPRPPIFHVHRPPPVPFRQQNIAIQSSPSLPVVSTPNASAVLQTVVQAIGGNFMPPLAQAKTHILRLPPPPPNADVSPYGKFF